MIKNQKSSDIKMGMNKANYKKKGPSPISLHHMLSIALIAVIATLLIYNQFQISSIAGKLNGAKIGSGSSGISMTGSAINIIPTGIPAIYGQELAISYNDVSADSSGLADQTIDILGQYDDGITLSGNDLQRYIEVASQISCEYCCGAKAIIFENGQAACGCAHSYAMRGLAKYIIKNHPTDFTDDQILEELGKWKVLFFPDIHEQKAVVLKEKGIELNYINLASNKYRGIETGTSGGSMVGGC